MIFLLYKLIVGIDSFNHDDPMIVNQKNLKAKIRFPSRFDSNDKSLVKHQESNLARRYIILFLYFL